MNLEAIASKLHLMSEKIARDKGPLDLLGLFLREESPGLWDLVIAAEWLKAGEFASFEYVTGRLRESLELKELTEISRVVILDHGGAVLNAFLAMFKNRTGLAEIDYTAEGGAVIRSAYIILTREMTPERPAGKTPKKPRQKKESSERQPENSSRKKKATA